MMVSVQFDYFKMLNPVPLIRLPGSLPHTCMVNNKSYA